MATKRLKRISTTANIDIQFKINGDMTNDWLIQFVESAIANEMARRNVPGSMSNITVSDINACMSSVTYGYQK